MPPKPDRRRPFVEKRGDRWRVRWPDADGKLRSASRDATGKPFADEAEAERFGWEQMGQIARGEWRDPTAPGITLTEWVNAWWPAQDLGRNTTNNYQWYIEAFILPAFGDRLLSSLTTLEITTWELGITKRGYAPTTGPAARSLLFTILGDAVLDPNTNLTTNPAARPPRARGRRSGRRRTGRAGKTWPTPLEVLLIAERLAALSGRDVDFVLAVTLGWTGMRWAEALGMQRQYLRETFYELDWQIPEVAGKFLREPLKSDSYRTHEDDGTSRVDLPPFLHKLLQRIIDSHDGRCSCPGTPPACGGSGWIFLGPERGHFRRSNYARRFWHPACDGMHPAYKSGARSRPAKPVLVDASVFPGRPLPAWPAAVPGEPFTPPSGRGVAPIPPDVPLSSWVPVKSGLVPHGLRHGHLTWLEEDRIARILQRERLGHREPGMGGRYTHVSDVMRAELVEALERRWTDALGARRVLCETSSVPLLQELLDGVAESEDGGE